jgi:hypothetical protein
VSDVQLVGLALVCLGVGWFLGIYYGVSRERDAMIGALIRYAKANGARESGVLEVPSGTRGSVVFKELPGLTVRHAPYDWSREGVL